MGLVACKSLGQGPVSVQIKVWCFYPPLCQASHYGNAFVGVVATHKIGVAFHHYHKQIHTRACTYTHAYTHMHAHTHTCMHDARTPRTQLRSDVLITGDRVDEAVRIFVDLVLTCMEEVAAVPLYLVDGLAIVDPPSKIYNGEIHYNHHRPIST